MTNTEYLKMISEYIAIKTSLPEPGKWLPADPDRNKVCGVVFEARIQARMEGEWVTVLKNVACGSRWDYICPACQDARVAACARENAASNNRRRQTAKAARLWKKIAAGYAEHAEVFDAVQ